MIGIDLETQTDLKDKMHWIRLWDSHEQGLIINGLEMQTDLKDKMQYYFKRLRLYENHKVIMLAKIQKE